MDPQKISLDPKLKEAYDSVMGNNSQLESQPPPLPPQEHVISPITWHASSPQIISQPPTSFPDPPIGQNTIPAPTIVDYHSSTQNIQQNKKVQEKKWKLLWTIVVFLIVAFLLGYAIFWIKVFGISIPILSSLF